MGEPGAFGTVPDWDTGDVSLLRLTPDFVHTRPFGCIERRETYLRGQ